MEEFEVELYKEGRGLGITIAGLVSEDTEGQSSKNLTIRTTCYTPSHPHTLTHSLQRN